MKRFLVLILVIFLVAASLISISTAFAAEPEFIEILKEKQTLQNDRIKVSANFVLPEKFDSLHINLNIVKFCKTLKTDTLNVKVEDENSLLVLSFSYTQRIFVNHPILVAALGYFKNGEEIFSEKRDLTDVPDIRIEIKNFEGLQIQINEQELTIDNFEETNFNRLTFETIWGDAYIAPLIIEIIAINLFYTESKEETTAEENNEDTIGNNTGQKDNQGGNKNIADHTNTTTERPVLLDIAAGVGAAAIGVFLTIKICKKIKISKSA